MPITSFDTFVAMAANNEIAQDHYYSGFTNATNSGMFGISLSRQLYLARFPALPSLPGGKSFFFPTSWEMACSTTRGLTLCRLTSFGSIDISGASGTFTDGSAAPSYTEGGVTRQIPSAILSVVTTATNATPGFLTVTYTDQNNNAPETTASLTLPASAPAGTAGWVTLNSTDWGALDITAAARSGGTTPTGVIEFFHVEPLGNIVIPLAGGIASVNFLTDLGCLYKLSAGNTLAVLGTGNSANAIQGRINYGVI